MADIPRPPTPQVLMHRLPSPPAQDLLATPSKYLLIMLTPMEYAFKTMLADELSTNFSCKYYLGDSIHRFCEKAAGVGGGGGEPNAERYSRMWLSRMTRTGLLFPEESKPVTSEFTGFGGGSTSTSRRGSISSVASEPESVGGSVFDRPTSTAGAKLASLRAALAKEEDKENTQPVLLVLTHPALESWSKQAIRSAVGEYGIGVIYLQLYEDEEDEDELPVLQPLSQLSMTSFGAGKQRGWGNLTEEMKIVVDTNQPVNKQAAEVTEDVQFIIGMDD